MPSPVLVAPIPPLLVNEQSALEPFDLKEFIQVADDEGGVRFHCDTLPNGLFCTEDGVLTGVPEKDTQGNYGFNVVAENAAGKLVINVVLVIAPSSAAAGGNYFDKLKTQIWDALEKKLPAPDFKAIFDRPVSVIDVYYLIERFAHFKIWNALDMDPASEKKIIELAGVSPHFDVYDCRNALVAAPKDLFSQERTLQDALDTARAMAREVYARGWIVEFNGFDKMERAAWVEIQRLEDQYGKKLDILHYDPSLDDLRIYTAETKRDRLLKRGD